MHRRIVIYYYSLRDKKALFFIIIIVRYWLNEQNIKVKKKCIQIFCIIYLLNPFCILTRPFALFFAKAQNRRV